MRQKFGLLLLTVSLGWSTSSAAEPTETDNANARALFKAGNAQRDQGNIDQAVELYRKAHALQTSPVPGVEAGRLLEGKGDLIGAVEIFREALRVPSFRETTVTLTARKEAEQRIGILERLIPRVVLDLGKSSLAVKILIDGRELPRAMLGMPYQLNPGKHVVQVLNGDQTIATRELTLAEGTTETVTLEVEGALAVRSVPVAHCTLAGVSESGPSRWTRPTMPTKSVQHAPRATTRRAWTCGVTPSVSPTQRPSFWSSGAPQSSVVGFCCSRRHRAARAR